MTDRRPELRALTAFRFIAAMAVFLRHIYPWLKDETAMPSFLLRCFHDGFSGVTFFFILSGFILTYNYRFTFARLDTLELKNFYAARVARIGPVHLLTIVLALPVIYSLILAAPLQSIGPALANLTLTQSLIPVESYYFSFNSVSWSLSDEIFFYALFPLILWGMHAIGCDRPRTSGGLAACIWLFAMACVLIGQNNPHGFWLWYINPCFRLLDFLVGVCLGQLFMGLQDSGFQGPSRRWATRLEVGSIALLAAALAFSPHAPYLLRRSAYYTPCFAALIFVFAYERGALSRLIGRNSMLLLGEASFSFYMFHYLLIRMVDHYPQATRLGPLPPFGRAAVVLAISLIISVCCYWWYELPARQRVKRWLVGPSKRPIATPA
jgi:peptidoglycan/LPS O-acetylase OafA/YrhL